MTQRFLSGDGWRARIGIVVPSVNTVMEPWAAGAAPSGVSIHFSRMFIPAETTSDTLVEMDRTDGKAAVHQLSSIHPHVIAYGCTASSIVQGVNYDAHLRGEISETYSVPATTAAYAIVTAAQTLGATRVSIASPYPAEIDAAEHRYFTEAGFDVRGGAFLGISDGFGLAEPEPATLFKLGMDACDKDADALIISCLNTRSHTVIAALEQALDKPVITSTQATFWHALRLAGVRDVLPDWGRLMSH